MTRIMLTTITACVECGMMQPTGFRGGTPVLDLDDPNVHFEVGESEIPDHIDEPHNIGASRSPCPVCGNHFYHRLDLPTQGRVDAVDDPEHDWVCWGDL